jgi:hypothetical protein
MDGKKGWVSTFIEHVGLNIILIEHVAAFL